MTAIESLELSIILWDWRIDNPNMHPSACPYVNTEGWVSNCALCEYDELMGNDDDCSCCPMNSKWPSSQGYHLLCNNNFYSLGTSAYNMFSDWDIPTYDQAFFAAVLVEAFRKRLQELKEVSE